MKGGHAASGIDNKQLMASFVEFRSLCVCCSSCCALSDRMVRYSASIGFSISISTTTRTTVHVGTVMAANPVFLIVARLFITHGKDIYLQSLNNPPKSRLALPFENPIFTTFRTESYHHLCSSFSCGWQCIDTEDTLFLSLTC